VNKFKITDGSMGYPKNSNPEIDMDLKRQANSNINRNIPAS